MPTEISRTVDLDGHTHYLELEGPAGPPPLVCVHGLGGSHVNWTAVASRLAEEQHVYVPDLAGHGLTFPDHRPTDVNSNQRLLDRFVREIVGRPVVLMGNSMGGLISILQAARHPGSVAGVVLVGPAVPAPARARLDREVTRSFATYAAPGLANFALARRRRTKAPADRAQELFDLCCVDSSRVPGDLEQRSIALVERRDRVHGVDAAFLDSARSVMLHLSARRNVVQTAMSSIRGPVLLIQGEKDRLVSLAAAQAAARANPSWEFRVAPDIGHVPQIEAPDWTIETYRRWATSNGILPTE
jgi:pimeloyl-ACP methyl ester carboxylesterase